MEPKKGRPYPRKLMVYTFPVTVVAYVGSEKSGAKEAWKELSREILVDEVPVSPPKGWTAVPLDESMLNRLWTRNSFPLCQDNSGPYNKKIGEILREQKKG